MCGDAYRSVVHNVHNELTLLVWASCASWCSRLVVWCRGPYAFAALTISLSVKRCDPEFGAFQRSLGRRRCGRSPLCLGLRSSSFSLGRCCRVFFSMCIHGGISQRATVPMIATLMSRGAELQSSRGVVKFVTRLDHASRCVSAGRSLSPPLDFECGEESIVDATRSRLGMCSRWQIAVTPSDF